MDQKEKEDQLALRLIDKHDELRSYVNDTYARAQANNIKQQRNLVIQFITISSAVIGFTIPVIGNSSLVQTKVFLIGGLAELLIVVLYGFWYLMHILQGENKGLEIMFQKYTAALDKKRDVELKFISDMSKENYTNWQTEMKKVADNLTETLPKLKLDYAVDIMFFAFFTALCLITTSMVIKL